MAEPGRDANYSVFVPHHAVRRIGARSERGVARCKQKQRVWALASTDRLCQPSQGHAAMDRWVCVTIGSGGSFAVLIKLRDSSDRS
jgi:hypothetical protein